MTVQRGQRWGVVTERPGDLVELADDAALAAHIAAARSAGVAPAPVALAGGALARTVGAPPWTDTAMVTRLPLDTMRVETAGHVAWAAAHVVARRGWWRGEVVAVMNAQYIGRWDVAPRAHPNDGRADVVHVAASMSVRDRWRARRRLPAGAHVPHPDIATRRAGDISLEFARPLDIWIDGVRWRRATAVRVEVVADAVDVCLPLDAG